MASEGQASIVPAHIERTYHSDLAYDGKGNRCYISSEATHVFQDGGYQRRGGKRRESTAPAVLSTAAAPTEA
jgi:hypothetical protein